MKTEILNKNNFNYIDKGKGKPIVLLHGLMGSLSNFKNCIEDLPKQGFRVIMPMLPIYDLPLLKTSAKELSNFLNRFTKSLDLDKFYLLGNSLGGHVGLIYTIKFQKKMKGLILTGSSGLYENALGGTFPKRGNYDYIKTKTEEVFYDPKCASKELVDEVYSTVNDRKKLIKILAMAKSAIRHNMKNELTKIEIPTCIIWGENDKVTPPEVAKEFHQLINNSDLFWIKNCGHAAMMERPKMFNETLINWIHTLKK